MAAYMAKSLCSRNGYFVHLYSTIARRTAHFRGVSPLATIQEQNRSRYAIFSASFAKKAGKFEPVAVVEEEPVEVNKNPEDLVKYCVGSNYFVEGSDVELKPDSEYPDWLWDLHIGPPKKLEEIEPNTKEYWRKLRKLNLKRNNRLAKLKKF